MKRRGICLLLVLLLLAGLAACGGGGETAAASDSAASSAGQEGRAGRGRRRGGRAPAADFSAVRQNAKLILSADLALETRDYDKAVADIEQMTAAAGGYIQSSGASGDPGSRFANYTLRVPQEKFESFFSQLGETCHVVSSNRWSEDVTDQYTDIETHLATLRTKHERLLSLLDQASKMEDIISLENALADCEYEIDSLTGEKRQYDDLVSFATITVSLSEVQTLTAVADGAGFGAQLAQAARSGLGGLTARGARGHPAARDHLARAPAARRRRRDIPVHPPPQGKGGGSGRGRKTGAGRQRQAVKGAEGQKKNPRVCTLGFFCVN